VRTLFSTSRASGVAVAIVAAALILGGAFFAGYVGETGRDQSDPSTLRHRTAAEVATVERALGYGGFLKAYRSYRLTGDAETRPYLSIKAAEAVHAIERLRTLYAGDAAAGDALAEAAAVTDAFAHVARIAPQLGDAALRGTAEMEALNGLPQSQQLETTYLSLRGAFDRLKQAGLEDRLGGAASALNSSQTLIIAGIAFVVLGLMAVAGLLNWGVVRPLKTLAHKADAAKDEIQVKFEGAASLALEKLASDVATATDALNVASADLIRLQGDGRRHFDAAVRNLTHTRAGFDEAAKIANESAAAAIDDLRASTAKLSQAADERAARLDEITARFDHGGRTLEQAFTAAKEKADVAAGGLASSSVSLNRLAEDARTLCHKVSSDSAAATGKVHTLASQLAEAVDAVDERMGQKLNALDNLEQHLSVTLAKVEERADETLTALNVAAVERGADAEAQLRKTAAAFEQMLCEFRVGVESFAKLGPSAQPVQSPAAAPEFDALAKALQAESETIRNEIRDFAVRLTEDRLLAGADMPFLGAKADDTAPRLTLADVPGDEIVARLKSLAAEMSAAQVERGDAAALQHALGAFAAEVKQLAPQADRAARLKTMGKAFDRHAEEIETQAVVIDPSADALRGEVHAITSELRTLAARAQAAHVKNAPALREAAIQLGERAEALFARFDRPVVDDADEAAPEPMSAATADLAALTQLIGRLEARAEHLARSALAARFTPGESGDTIKTENAIHAVFESIERLNNIAAALARAGDAERLRRAAH
jgi:hypothetical protein